MLGRQPAPTPEPAPQPVQPSLADMLALADRLRPPPAPRAPSEARGLAKHASNIIVALVLALTAWVGSSITSLSTTVTRVSATVDQVQKSVGDIQAAQGGSQSQLGDLKAGLARQDARADAAEADITRVKERVRQLEGRAPLELPTRPGTGSY